MHAGVASLVSPREGHFLLESGLHGAMWLDLETLFLHPATIEPLVDELASRLARYDADVICGPLVEGAFAALLIARKLGLPFTYSERHAPYDYRIPRSQHPHLRGKRVLIVNDVISAGSAVGGTHPSLVALDATPIAIGALLVLGDWTARFAAQHAMAVEALETMPYGLWRAEECPLCATNVPLGNAGVSAG